MVEEKFTFYAIVEIPLLEAVGAESHNVPLGFKSPDRAQNTAKKENNHSCQKPFHWRHLIMSAAEWCGR